MTDIKSKTVTSTGALGLGGARSRIRGVYFVCSGTAGSISLKDGGASGNELLNMATPAGATITDNVIFPGDGILFQADPYLTLTNVTSVTFFYG